MRGLLIFRLKRYTCQYFGLIEKCKGLSGTVFKKQGGSGLRWTERLILDNM